MVLVGIQLLVENFSHNEAKDNLQRFHILHGMLNVSHDAVKKKTCCR